MSETPVRFESDVKIRKNDEGVFSVLLNGEEMNMQILADSMRVEFPSSSTEYGLALVTFTVVAGVDIEVTDAEVALS